MFFLKYIKGRTVHLSCGFLGHSLRILFFPKRCGIIFGIKVCPLHCGACTVTRPSRGPRTPNLYSLFGQPTAHTHTFLCRAQHFYFPTKKKSRVHTEQHTLSLVVHTLSSFTRPTRIRYVLGYGRVPQHFVLPKCRYSVQSCTHFIRTRSCTARMPARSVCLVTLSLSEAGPGRFGGQVSVTDIYHATTMPHQP